MRGLERVGDVRVMDPVTGQVRVMTGDEAARYFARLQSEGRLTVVAHVAAAALILACLGAATYSLSLLAERQREACGQAEVEAGLGGDPVPEGCREVRR